MANHMSTASLKNTFKIKVKTCIVPEMIATKATNMVKASHIEEFATRDKLLNQTD